MNAVCPCCSQAVAKPDPQMLRFVRLGEGIGRIVLDILIDRFGLDIPITAVVARAYDGVRDGGPEGARECVHVSVVKLRKKIAPFGFRISDGRGGSYRLEWLE